MREIKKGEQVLLRMTTQEKESLKKLSGDRGMTMSEYLVYLIRREADWERLYIERMNNKE